MQVYIITAKRSNGETMFYCDSETQGSRMVPNAQSIATIFDSESECRRRVSRLALGWPGLRDWKLEPVRSWEVEKGVADYLYDIGRIAALASNCESFEAVSGFLDDITKAVKEAKELIAAMKD